MREEDLFKWMILRKRQSRKVSRYIWQLFCMFCLAQLTETAWEQTQHTGLLCSDNLSPDFWGGLRNYTSMALLCDVGAQPLHQQNENNPQASCKSTFLRSAMQGGYSCTPGIWFILSQLRLLTKGQTISLGTEHLLQTKGALGISESCTVHVQRFSALLSFGKKLLSVLRNSDSQ